MKFSGVGGGGGAAGLSDHSKLLHEIHLVHGKLDKLLGMQEGIAASIARSEVRKEDPRTSASRRPQSEHSEGFSVTPSRSLQKAASRRLSSRSIHEECSEECSTAKSGSLSSSKSRLEDCLAGKPIIKLNLRDLQRAKNPSMARATTGHMRLPHVRNSIVSSAGVSDIINRILPLAPTSPLVLTFDFASMLFLVYDCIMIPHTLAWNIAADGFYFHFAWISAAFWTVDILLHFVKAITLDSELVTEFRRIACHYLQRFFIVDVFVVGIDWVGFVMKLTESDSGSVTTYAGFIRLLKISRMARIITMIKTERLDKLKEWILHQAYIYGVGIPISFIGGVLKLMILIVWLNHITSCVWVAVQSHGSALKDTAIDWERVISERHGAQSFEDPMLSDAFKYCAAYYWAISTMFSGASSLQPTNTAEYILSSVYVLFGVLFASGMISMMAAMWMGRHQANHDRNVKMKLLSQFLLQHRIDPVTCVMVQRQARDRMEIDRRLMENDVSLINLLSPQLRQQIRCTVWTPVLMDQPLWRACVYVDDHLIKNLCKFAIECVSVLPGEVVFDIGNKQQHSYILMWGTMLYCLEEDLIAEEAAACPPIADAYKQASVLRSFSSLPTNGVGGQVIKSQNQHICEIALWSDWTTVGMLEASTACELLVCSADAVIERVLTASPATRHIVQGFSEALALFFEIERPAALSDFISEVDYDAIVAYMSQEPRVMMSTPALEALSEKKAARNLEALEQEITNGVCNLGQDSLGHVLRIVRLVALRLTNSEGRVAVKLGDAVNNEWHLSLLLPGVKSIAQETLAACTNRLLNKYFPTMASSISWQRVEVDVQVKPSSQYHIPTKYIRTMLHASVSDSDMEKFKKAAWKTQTFSWRNYEILCTSAFETEEMRQQLIAWMTPHQFAKLVESDCEGRACIQEWCEAFRTYDPDPSTSGSSILGKDLAASNIILEEVAFDCNIGGSHVFYGDEDVIEDTMCDDWPSQENLATETSEKTVVII